MDDEISNQAICDAFEVLDEEGKDTWMQEIDGGTMNWCTERMRRQEQGSRY